MQHIPKENGIIYGLIFYNIELLHSMYRRIVYLDDENILKIEET